jgi:tetratricopeptide (TPR) repeat protein
MQQAAPEAVQTSRATVELAKVVFDEDSSRALALVDAARQKALAVGEASLRNDAEFTQACFLQTLHQPAQARAVWEGILEREQDPEFAAHVRIFLAATYTSERRFEEALSVYEDVATDEHCSEAARATALVHEAQTLRSLGRRAEALSVLDDVIVNYPQALSTGAARALHASWSKR